MTIFGRWFRTNGHDALSPLDMEATRAAVQRNASFSKDLDAAAAKVKRQVEDERNRDLDADRERFYQERKEQSIIAALVFGCSCGDRAPDGARHGLLASLPAWLRIHAHCAGLGAMVREDV